MPEAREDLREPERGVVLRRWEFPERALQELQRQRESPPRQGVQEVPRQGQQVGLEGQALPRQREAEALPLFLRQPGPLEELRSQPEP